MQEYYYRYNTRYKCGLETRSFFFFHILSSLSRNIIFHILFHSAERRKPFSPSPLPPPPTLRPTHRTRARARARACERVCVYAHDRLGTVRAAVAVNLVKFPVARRRRTRDTAAATRFQTLSALSYTLRHVLHFCA